MLLCLPRRRFTPLMLSPDADAAAAAYADDFSPQCAPTVADALRV